MNQKKLLIFILLFYLFDCSVAFAAQQTLRIGVFKKNTTFHPLFSSGDSDRYITQFIHAPIVSLDAKWQWVCSLCVELPTFENKLMHYVDDKKTKIKITWKMKPNANWSDGRAITGYDALFTWNIVKNYSEDYTFPHIFYQIDDILVDPADPKVFTIVFKDANFQYQFMRDFYLLSSHYEKNAIANKDVQQIEYKLKSVYNSAPLTQGLYSSRYYVASISENELLLKQNKSSAFIANSIENIQITFFQTVAQLAESFKNKSIDVISESNLHIDELTQLEALLGGPSQKKYNFVDSEGITFDQITFNLRNPLLHKLSMRVAIYNLIKRDVEAFKSTVLLPFNSFFHAKSSNHTAFQNFPIMANEAISKELDYMDWKVQKDGFRYKAGEKLVLTLLVLEDRLYATELYELFRKSLKQIGVELVLNKVSRDKFFERHINKANFHDLALFTWELFEGFLPHSRLYSTESPTDRNGYVGQNIGSWHNKSFDQNINALKVEFDLVKRKKLIEDLQTEVFTLLPIVPLYKIKQRIYFQSNIENIELPGHQFPSSALIEKVQIR